ncbi:MAG: hypothetical protein ACREJM_00790 [Candidatus Saccharimonadales bacterium]
MAVKENEDSASDEQKTDSTVKVGDGGQTAKRRRMHVPAIKNKKPLIIGLAVLVVVIVGAVIFSRETHIGQKVYAQAAGHKIYKEDIQAIIGKEKGITTHQAATVLADKYLTEAMAKEDKVVVTDQDIETAYGKNILLQKTKQPYEYQQVVNNLYFKKLATYNQSGTYRGEYLIANFSQHVPYPSPLLKEQEAGDPTLGNPKLIAADRKYAGEFITKLYKQIVSHKITFDQAIKEERNDSAVGTKAYPTQPHSGPFDTSAGYGLIVNADATRAKLRTIKQGTMTKPFLAGESTSVEAGPYYLVIRMDEAKGGPGLPYDQFLQQAKQKFGYKIYV